MLPCYNMLYVCKYSNIFWPFKRARKYYYSESIISAKFDGKYIEHIGGLMSRPPSCFGVEANCMAAVNPSLFS